MESQKCQIREESVFCFFKVGLIGFYCFLLGFYCFLIGVFNCLLPNLAKTSSCQNSRLVLL